MLDLIQDTDFTTTLQAGLPFAVFTLAVGVLVLIDLGVSRRSDPSMAFGRAVAFTIVWVAVAVVFGLWIGFTRGTDAALAYFAAYVIEQSLSLDNMVVFLTIFASFAVPLAQQRRVLSWGVVGAIVMRGAAIFAGVELLERLSWIRYIFGALLIVGSVRLLKSHSADGKQAATIQRLVGRVVPITPDFRGDAFFDRMNGHWAVTPLFVALVAIELSDIVFATDSIPAVFAATSDPFLVYTSNLLAVLGLRSLYFLVAGVIPRLRFIRYGLTAILAFVGAKMLLGDVVHISTAASLIVIGGVLAASVGASLWVRRTDVARGL